MFARSWTGLPKDAQYSNDLHQLGYEIAANDTVSSVEHPGEPFRYMVDKNDRINTRRGFTVAELLQKEILCRLKSEKMQTVNLPLESSNNSAHVQVLASDNFTQCHHVVLFLNDSKARLGVIDTSSLLGSSGITKGSTVALVQALNSQLANTTLGIVLANPGQLYWWPEGKQSITTRASNDLELPSLVHLGRKFHAHLNSILGHETPEEHLMSIMRDVVELRLQTGAKLSIIAAGDGCDVVQRFFTTQDNWKAWGESLNAVVFCGPTESSNCTTNGSWKDFISKRGKGYLLSDEPLDSNVPARFGFPCASSGEPLNAASILVQAMPSVISYIKQTTVDPQFQNPQDTEAQSFEDSATDDAWRRLADDAWKQVADEDKPTLSVVIDIDIEAERLNLRRWKAFEKSGEVREDEELRADIGPNCTDGDGKW